MAKSAVESPPAREVEVTRVYGDLNTLVKQIAADSDESIPEVWDRLAGERALAEWEERQQRQRQEFAARKRK